MFSLFAFRSGVGLVKLEVLSLGKYTVHVI